MKAGQLAYFAAISMMCISISFGEFENQLLRIGNTNEDSEAPHFYGDMDAAGYSDWILYGPSTLHEHSFHEVLSGEWAAAIYYDGIDTEPTADTNDDPTRKQAMWLTKSFVYADWNTNSDFRFDGTCSAWHYNNNPTPNNNIGKSIIRNDHVQIDYATFFL